MKTLDNLTEKEIITRSVFSNKKEILEIQPHRVLTEAEFHRFSVRYSTIFDAGIGAEAVFTYFEKD
jgi:hypothetical protein